MGLCVISTQVASIMPCRFMDKNGLGNISLAVLCYDWCLGHGANVLSSSFGIYERYGENVLKVSLFCVFYFSFSFDYSFFLKFQ